MEVDSTSTPPSHRQSAGTIHIKPISTPFPTTPALGPSDRTPTPGPSDHTTVSATPCEKCVHQKSACVFKEGAFACVDCQRLKSRCMRVPEQWRRKGGKPTLELMDRAKMPQPAHVKTTKMPKMPKTPKTLCAQSKSHAPSDTILTILPPHPQQRESIPSSVDLGQVSSDYVYLLSREDQNVSFGLRVHGQETSNQGDDCRDATIQRLEQANLELREQVRHLSHQTRLLNNTIDMLVAEHNGHTSMLESHQLHICRDFKILDDEPTPDGLPATPAPTPDSLFGVTSHTRNSKEPHRK